MAVPEAIRKVPRPKNTIVDDNGRDGPLRYAVRVRAGIKYVYGANPKPRNGRVIGHIINNCFVPVTERPCSSCSDLLSYGSVALVKSLTRDILTDLLAIYPPKEAYAIMAIATLRVIRPSLSTEGLSSYYKRTFVCRDYPGIGLSWSSVRALYKKIGQDGIKRKLFYQKRINSVITSHHIAIDGTIKPNTANVNDLSEFSFQYFNNLSKSLKILYAYDIESIEPISFSILNINSIRYSSYISFIKQNCIENSIIVYRNRFINKKNKICTNGLTNIHFIKMSKNKLQAGENTHFGGIVDGTGNTVLYKKQVVKSRHYLYSFKKINTSNIRYIDNNKNLQNTESLFNSISLESDSDIDPKIAYKCHDSFLIMKLAIKRYKSNDIFDKIDLQSNFALIGSEFINFISTIATCRILRKARIAGLLERRTLGELMDDLSSAWRAANAKEPPWSHDESWGNMPSMVFEELEALGLSLSNPKLQPVEVGRTRKGAGLGDKPKRPRGRPRKNILPEVCQHRDTQEGQYATQ